MMIMTIWWSKATRLLEFSRSSVKRTLRHEEEVGPGFFVTEDRGGGIGCSSEWIDIWSPLINMRIRPAHVCPGHDVHFNFPLTSG